MPSVALPPFDPHWALFLDIDGTLLEHAAHPQAVQVGAGLIALIADLMHAAGGALALISGRSVADLDALFAPLRLPVAGQHGTERRAADGRTLPSIGTLGRLDAAERTLQSLTAVHPALLIEHKGLTLALHYRRAPELATIAEREMRAIAADLGEGFELQSGKYVVEVKPRGADKGTAIAAFLTEPPFVGRRPVFIGDDLTDEAGFALVERRDGYAIKVGAGDSGARWRLADAAAVRRWLGEYVGYVNEVAHRDASNNARGTP